MYFWWGVITEGSRIHTKVFVYSGLIIAAFVEGARTLKDYIVPGALLLELELELFFFRNLVFSGTY